jgi:protein SCO1/2
MASSVYGNASSDDSTSVFNASSPVKGAEITEKLGDYIPLDDLQLISENGQLQPLRSFILPDKPIILNLGYFDCPKLCGLVTNGLLKGMQQTQWTPGVDYQVLTISLNPNEQYPLAAEKKANYLKKFDRKEAENGWRFLTGDQTNLSRLSELTGFGFVWDERQQQFVHAAAIVVLSPDGRITRYLYGIEYPELQLRSALYEAADGKVGSTLDKVILYCFEFDPNLNSYVPEAINIMKLGGLVTMLGLGIFLSLFWLHEKRSKRAKMPLT